MNLGLSEYEYQLSLQYYGKERRLIHTFFTLLIFLLLGKPVQLLRELGDTEQSKIRPGFRENSCLPSKQLGSTHAGSIIHTDDSKCATVFMSNLLCLYKCTRASRILTYHVTCFSVVKNKIAS